MPLLPAISPALFNHQCVLLGEELCKEDTDCESQYVMSKLDIPFLDKNSRDLKTAKFFSDNSGKNPSIFLKIKFSGEFLAVGEFSSSYKRAVLCFTTGTVSKSRVYGFICRPSSQKRL